MPSVTGVEALAEVGTPTITASSNIALNGLSATAAAGTFTLASSLELIGVESVAGIGSPLVLVFGNETNIPLGGVQSVSGIGVLHASISLSLQGVQGLAQVGTLQPLIFQSGFQMDELSVESLVIDDTVAKVSLRCSQTKGASWETPRVQSLGSAGQYATNISWRNVTGIARDVVFEISWSAPVNTSLTGLFALVEGSGS